MGKNSCTDFLQWALPKIGYCWRGFKKVKNQVCKRVKSRLKELSLGSLDDYKVYLKENENEWKVFDSFCYITISRFFRNKKVFEVLGEEIFPKLIERQKKKNENVIKCWSVGCASGEEPYSINIAWKEIAKNRNDFELKITATELDRTVLERAEKGEYQSSSLKNVPDELLDKAFSKSNEHYIIKEKYKSNISFIQQNIKEELPEDKFQFIFCRNLVLTYFDEEYQNELLDKSLTKLEPGGFFVIGSNESIPEGRTDLINYKESKDIFVKK